MIVNLEALVVICELAGTPASDGPQEILISQGQDVD